MHRRAFLVTFGGGLLAAPIAAEAQQAGKVYRIGILTATRLVASHVWGILPRATGTGLRG